MKIDEISEEIAETAQGFEFVTSIRLLDKTDYSVKYRLYLNEMCYVQVYFNTRSGTVNYVFVHHFARIFARDCCDGEWHRHPYHNPNLHNISDEGRRPVSLSEFLEEVREILEREKIS